MSDHAHHVDSNAAPVRAPFVGSVLGRVLYWGIPFFIFLSLSVWAGLPWVIRSVLLPRVAQELGIADVQLELRRISLWGLDVGPVSIGSGFSMQAAQLDWSFVGLLQGRLDSVRLLGLVVQVSENGTGWNIAGLPLPQERSDAAASEVIFPRIDVLSLEGSLRIERPDQAVTVSFWAEGGWDGRESMHGRVQLVGQQGAATIAVPKLHVTAHPFQLACEWSVEVQSLLGAVFESAPLLSGTTRITRSELSWEAHTQAELASMRVRTGGQTVILTPLTVEMYARAGGEESQLNAVLRMDNVSLTDTERTASLSGLVGTVNATAGAFGGEGLVTLSEGIVRAFAPGLDLVSTRLQVQGAFAWGERTHAKATVMADLRTKAGDLFATTALRLPLAWPDPSSTPGTLDVQTRWKKVDAASVSVRLIQGRESVRLDGHALLQPLGLRSTVRGEVNLVAPASSWVDVQADQNIDLPGNLATIVPDMRAVSGRVAVHARMRLHMPRGQVEIPAYVEVRDAQLAHSPSGFALHGGFVSLDFADALSMRSKPNQKFGFSRVQVGKVVLEKADIRYQLEAPQSILVESGALTWAGGRVGTQAFRINPGIEDYEVELYCDRIELAQALEQFGMRKARGGGRANGRIPVRYANGLLTFSDGFLYSTPGEPGVLHIAGTEILTAGVPSDAPQFGQLDLASEALKDFTYEWAKIRLQTQNRELVVALELDGKPSHALPFVYNQDIGGFARVAASSPGSVFQGIRLDVTFHLPLDQLVQYRQLLKLFKNGG